MKMKKHNKLKISLFLTLFAGVTLSYAIWLVWSKLTEFIGNSWMVLGICAVILAVLGFLGYFKINKIANKFK